MSDPSPALSDSKNVNRCLLKSTDFDTTPNSLISDPDLTSDWDSPFQQKVSTSIPGLSTLSVEVDIIGRVLPELGEESSSGVGGRALRLMNYKPSEAQLQRHRSALESNKALIWKGWVLVVGLCVPIGARLLVSLVTKWKTRWVFEVRH